MKYRYDLTAIVSNFDHLRYFKDMVGDYKLSALVDFLLSNPDAGMIGLYLFAVSHGYLSEYRRNVSMLNLLLNERKVTYGKV